MLRTYAKSPAGVKTMFRNVSLYPPYYSSAQGTIVTVSRNRIYETDRQTQKANFQTILAISISYVDSNNYSKVWMLVQTQYKVVKNCRNQVAVALVQYQ